MTVALGLFSVFSGGFAAVAVTDRWLHTNEVLLRAEYQ